MNARKSYGRRVHSHHGHHWVPDRWAQNGDHWRRERGHWDRD